MIDALLYAVRDAAWRDLGYDERTCDVRADGHPRQDMGDVYVAVHQGTTRQGMDNALDEYFSFSLTLTMRVTVPLDRVGDRLLALKLAGDAGFNRKAERLRSFFHMAWGVIQDANNYISQWSSDAHSVYGFCEPARYRGMDVPSLVGGEWFTADPDAQDTGLRAELRFEDARRFEAIATFS